MNRKLLYLLLLFLASTISSKPVFFLENLNSSRFPNIEIELRENFNHPLSSSNLVLAEDMDGIRTIPADLEIRREKGIEPIQLVVSVQPTDSKAINQWTTDLVISLSTLLNENDRYSVHIQEERRFLYQIHQTTKSLQSGFILPSVDSYSNTLETISILLDKLSVTGKKSPFLVAVIHSKSIPDKIKIVELTKKARQMGIPIHILGFPSEENRKIAEYSDGKFYSLKEKDSTQKLFSDIKQYKMPPYKIRYTSKNKVGFFDEKIISVDLGIMNLQNINSEYELSWSSRIENSIRDPYVFLPVSIFIFMLCISALYLLPRLRYPKFSKNKEKYPELNTKVFDETKAYEQMYGRKEGWEGEATSQYIDEENNLTTNENQIRLPIVGEKYQKAVLIQKSGPNPGKQYTIFGSETILGKSETADFVIWDSFVSNTHAKIINLQDHFILYDLLSDSGVFLNGKKLLRPKVLYDFDEIKVGKTLLIFRGK
jgi:hypothetical protein